MFIAYKSKKIQITLLVGLIFQLKRIRFGIINKFNARWLKSVSTQNNYLLNNYSLIIKIP